MLAVRILASSAGTMLRLHLRTLLPTFAIALLLAAFQANTAHAQIRSDAVSASGTTTQPPPGTTYLPPPDDPDPTPTLYDAATGVSISAPTTMAPGATAYVTVTMRNSGTTTWYPGMTNPYRLGSQNPQDNTTWGVGRVELGSTVAPGGQAAFSFMITAPSTPGTYAFGWAMLREGLHWFGSNISSTITVAVPAPVYDAQLVSASVPTTMTAGSYYNVSMTFRNSGNTTWTSPDFLLANPDDNLTFGLKRVAMSTSSVAPGQNATFNFQVRAPSTASTYTFQWGMVWEYHQRFGQYSTTYITVSASATPKPTISPSHTAMVAGQSFTMSWSTTNATSLSHVCSASGTGYTVNESLATSGSRSMTAQAGWVSYPSTCTWTATGPGGTTTVSETLTTTAAATPKPTITVSRPSSLVAGQSFTTSWSTLDATSLTHVCTAPGTGYTVNESLAVSGSRALTAQSGWVGYPSSCTWTASGAGGTSTFTETMTTVAGASSSVTYIHTDGLGSPVARSDANGKVISQTRYEPYGYVASGVQPTIGFTGHVNDVDTGLTYMQQRYYDPVAGRFLSIDPVVADTNGGKSFNRYAYANNSPYKYIDPDGRDPGELTAWPVPSSGVLNKADKPGEGDGRFGTSRAGGSRSHTGIDIQAKDGVKVVAAGDGKVVNIQPNPSGTYGNQVVINHGNGVFTQSAHLASTSVKPNDTVSAGQEIGTAGRTGNTPKGGDTHLHFEVRVGSPAPVAAGGKVIDPIKVLPPPPSQ